MAEKSFRVKNSIVVKDVEIDPSGASNNQVLKYNGTKFVPAAESGGGGATVSDTPPSSPSSGQIWYESDTGKTFVYYDSFWVEISSGAQGKDGIVISSTAPSDTTVLWADTSDNATEVKTFVQATQPTGIVGPYIWWDTSISNNLTLWIEDGV